MKQENDNTTPHSAAIYSSEIQKTIPYYEAFHEQTLELVKTYMPSPKNWLDIGCGTGALVLQASTLFPDTEYYLLDPSEKMLLQAQLLLQAIKKCHYLPCCTSQNMIPYVHQTMEVITAIQVHHYLKPEERALATQNIYALLQEGGLYITFENVRPFSKKGTYLALERWGQYQEQMGRDHEVVEAHKQRLDQNYFPITIEEHMALLRDTGFRVYEPFWLSYMQAGFYAIK